MIDAPVLGDAIGRRIARILEAAMAAVEPGAAVRRALAGHELADAPPGPVMVVAWGKAAPAMASAAVELLGSRVRGGVVVGKSGVPARIGPLTTTTGSHPVPTSASVEAGDRIAAIADACGPGDTLLVLLSGGASALAVQPVHGVGLPELARTTGALLKAGVEIGEINAVRKHLDALKGGGLALRAAPARVITLVVSDVVGDRLDAIGSGPTVGDRSTWSDAAAAIAACGDDVPGTVRRAIDDGCAGRRAETPTAVPGEDAVTIVARNADAVAAGAEAARREGYTVETRTLVGPASVVGRRLAVELTEHPATHPWCSIGGGETTVEVRGDGLGGRNTELVLAGVEPIAGSVPRRLVGFSTDGEDGPTDAAGAVATERTFARARARGLSIADALARNDAYHFFSRVGGLLKTGPSGTNVCDLSLALVDGR